MQHGPCATPDLGQVEQLAEVRQELAQRQQIVQAMARAHAKDDGQAQSENTRDNGDTALGTAVSAGGEPCRRYSSGGGVGW